MKRTKEQYNARQKEMAVLDIKRKELYKAAKIKDAAYKAAKALEYPDIMTQFVPGPVVKGNLDPRSPSKYYVRKPKKNYFEEPVIIPDIDTIAQTE